MDNTKTSNVIKTPLRTEGHEEAAPLTVYKASAGSGKTYTLAVEYISLLVKKPDSFREILAVTFTNKATAEMKIRILSQLYGIAHNCQKSKSYLDSVKEKTGISDERIIRERAGEALSLLMHHYHDFHVQTIDAFFQRVLRNLAHELDLSNSLRVSLNDKDVEDQAVDEMIQNLSPTSKELKWISEYINTNIDDNKNWNVIGQIKDFGNNIFRDFYKKHREEIDRKLTDTKFFNAFTSALVRQREGARKAITESAQRIIDVLDSHGLNDPELFPYGYRGSILMTIRKVADGVFDGSPSGSRIAKAIDDPLSWAKKNTHATNDLTALAESDLCRMLDNMEETRLKNWNPYESAVLTLRHLSQLRLLRAIGETVDGMNHDAGRFPLSETQMLLNGLIENQDAPFIFEKIGSRLRDIMIDEFQDTSTVQWDNFKVLLDNCLSERDSHSLIVGDVKQSIYRWRNGDWKLINSFANADDKNAAQIPNRNNGFADYQVHVETLKTNFRSEEKIIRFNNAFFTQAAKNEGERLADDGLPQSDVNQLLTAYEDVCQKIKKENGNGSVRLKLLPSEDYREKVIGEVLDTVVEMISEGVKTKDIAILVRANKEIPDIADAFAKDDRLKDVRLVSDEAFRLDSSIAVNMIITAMRLLVHDDDKVAKAELVKNYHQYVLLDKKAATQLIMSVEEMDDQLPKEFVENRIELITKPITDLVDKIIELFNIQSLTDQSAYVCSFQDLLAEYLQDNTADISNFLKLWDDTLHEKTIQSDEINGIRLISIHKSKGLEFPNVIVPFCDWQLEKLNTIWCETGTKGKPYNELPVVPVDFSKKSMTGTVYEKDYFEEHLQNIVDNLNLLYVAFTRAGQNLVVIGKRRGKKAAATGSNRSELIEDCLQTVAGELDATVENIDDYDEPIVFKYGKLYVGKKDVADSEEEEEEENVFNQPVSARKIAINSYDYPVVFRQSNESRDFINGDDTPEADRRRYIKLGNVMHNIFAHIRTTDDIEPQLRQLEQDGVIYSEEFDAKDLRSSIERAMQNPQVRDWFSPRWRLYNECTILEYKSGETIEHRPDRVMTDGKEWIVVDFKFGQRNDHDYSIQVGEYMDLISRMGVKNISGYIWYVMRNEIVKVNSKS